MGGGCGPGEGAGSAWMVRMARMFRMYLLPPGSRAMCLARTAKRSRCLVSLLRRAGAAPCELRGADSPRRALRSKSRKPHERLVLAAQGCWCRASGAISEEHASRGAQSA